MQYTLRNIPAQLDRVLRAKAKREGKSLNEVLIECLARALGLGPEPTRHRSLEDVAGTWVADAEVERALEDQRVVDPDLWR